MFATHLHQLKDISDVQCEKSIKNMHIDVEYNEDTGELIYNRIILPGQGSSMYGLEFAKFMQMDKTFLSRAYEIRKDVSSKLDGIELLTSKKKSLYNNDKYLGLCEICGDGAEEVHHIAPQKDADSKGIIDHFHKNHKANLLSVCHKCHMDIEHGDLVILGKKMTSSGLKVIKG
jgi:DNA mismatch repair protein MutS